MTAAARRALISGLGLIGGSIGMALRQRGWHVAFVDPHVTAADALARGAADQRVESLSADADVIVLAAPIDVALRQLAEIPPRARATSVCSLLAPLTAATRLRARERELRFVAGHPMAGSQERGLAAASATLFDGTRWFLDAATSDPLIDSLVLDCGATIERVDPAEHDGAVALTSHLPQLLSTALAAAIGREGESTLRYAGSGLRTFLRLAGSDASVWSPIFAANEENIADARQALERVLAEILDGDTDDAFTHAQRVWAKLKTSDS